MTRPAILDAFASHEFLRPLDDWCLMDLAKSLRERSVDLGGLLGDRSRMREGGIHLEDAGPIGEPAVPPLGVGRRIRLQGDGNLVSEYLSEGKRSGKQDFADGQGCPVRVVVQGDDQAAGCHDRLHEQPGMKRSTYTVLSGSD
jgi:hypothetical protein